MVSKEMVKKEVVGEVEAIESFESPTTTLRILRDHGACAGRYRILRRHLGKEWPEDKPIPLKTILESNGIHDITWCLRVVVDKRDWPSGFIAYVRAFIDFPADLALLGDAAHELFATKRKLSLQVLRKQLEQSPL